MCSAVKTRLYLAQHQLATADLNLAAEDDALNIISRPVQLY